MRRRKRKTYGGMVELSPSKGASWLNFHIRGDRRALNVTEAKKEELTIPIDLTKHDTPTVIPGGQEIIIG